MAGKFKARCALDERDQLSEHTETDELMNECVFIKISSYTGMLIDEVYLSQDDARALFDWLGVWLHGGNRP